MNECTKAHFRRQQEFARGDFNWARVFRGRLLDVGCGGDPMSLSHWLGLDEVAPFDLEHGDANRLDEYFEPGSFEVVHGSQVLEHMNNPFDAFKRWLRLVAVGGHIVISVPDYDLYEQGVFPSKWNADHKSTWSLWHQEVASSPRHVWVPRLLTCPLYRPQQTEWEVERLALVDTNYDYMKIGEGDQTLGDAEAFIEFVVRRVA